MIKEQAQVSGYFYKTCSKIDAVAISDNYWLGTTTPALTYGLRGCNYYQIKVNGPQADLHSGVFGGCIAEPMVDLVQLLSTLVSSQGEILIPGVKEMVAPVTEEEKKFTSPLNTPLKNSMNPQTQTLVCLITRRIF